MTRILWPRHLGDTGPPLDYTLRAEPGIGQRFGLPRDLTTATSIIGTVRRWSDRAIVSAATATVIGSPVNGNVRLPLSTTISTSAGLHGVEFIVVDPAEQRTYPASALQPAWLLVAAPLGASVGTTPPPVGAPLFVPNGGTGLVTTEGQLVFAGAGATITIPAGITWIQLAWWDTQTPWATGTVPTLIQAGSTVAAGVSAALLGSGGNLVVITSAAGIISAASTGRATIWSYNGTTYAPAPAARLIEQGLGEPAPSGVQADDILLKQNP